MLGIFNAFFSSAESSFWKDTFRVSNSSDPDQARHFVQTYLGLSCLRRLSVDDTSKQRVKISMFFF